MLKTLMLLACGAPLGVALWPTEPAPLVAQDEAPTYEGLLEEYEAAVAAWRQRVKDAEGTRERRDARASHPAPAFAPRFTALAEVGEGRALLWRARNLRELGLSTRERGPALRALFGSLVAGFADQAWFTELPREIYLQRRLVGEAEAEALLVALDADSTPEATRAEALSALVDLLGRSDAEDAAARAEALLVRLEEEFGGTRPGMAARARRLAGKTQPGNPAPDFKGSTIDGFEFELSEYRGKVVLLDFYGFW